jgi:hypothetical protein
MSAAWVALKALKQCHLYGGADHPRHSPWHVPDRLVHQLDGRHVSTFLAWNVHIVAEGAVFVASCTGKPVVDLIGVRGVHVRGLHVYGSTTSIPSCGILMGPRNTDTCGNNKFDNVKTTGYFSKAAAATSGRRRRSTSSRISSTRTPTARRMPTLPMA